MIQFDANLIADKTISKNNIAYKSFTLKVEEDSSVRVFPQQFASDFDTTMFHSSATSDAWKNINIPTTDYNLKYTVEFAGNTFEAKLENFSAKIRRKKDGTVNTTYTLTFTKELDVNATIDTIISNCLNVKEEDPNGKMVLVNYATTLTKI